MHSFRNSIRKYLHKEPIIVGPGIKTGISVQMENPKAVGAGPHRGLEPVPSMFTADRL